MKEVLPRVVPVATVCAVIAYPAFTVFGVIYLTEGKTALGLILLACVAFGVPSFVQWRRRFASRLARPSQ